MIPDSAFRHHPNLRGKIKDPASSFFRGFKPQDLEGIMETHGLPGGWWFSEDQIEAHRAKTLADHEGDLWVFGYGSLMWDPSVVFTEVIRARVHGVARRFCLLDTLGGRGTEAAPGVMAALDTGDFCDGLAFRIPAAALATETRVLWNREMMAPAYLAAWLIAETKLGPQPVLAFVADHSADLIQPDISHQDMVRFAATGAGFMGTSLAYVENLVENFEALGIEDPAVSRLLADARAYRPTEV